MRVYGQKSWEMRAELVAEKRPDGKWYLSREWDATGYATLYVSEGGENKKTSGGQEP